MAQDFTVNFYDINHVVDDDMENCEDNFESLRSAFSGANAPANAVPGQFWLSTTYKALRVRNPDNNGYYGVVCGDASFKIPVYRNDAMIGMRIDTSVYDVVVALKGGSQSYNVSAGQTAGTWTQPSHTLTNSEMPSHRHSGTTQVAGSHFHNFTGATPKYGYSGTGGSYGNALFGGTKSNNVEIGIDSANDHAHNFYTQYTGSGSSHNHGSTYRPKAAVCTLQYPDLR